MNGMSKEQRYQWTENREVLEKRALKSGMVAHTCNLTFQKVEPRRLWVQSQPELYSEILSPEIKYSFKEQTEALFFFSITQRNWFNYKIYLYFSRGNALIPKIGFRRNCSIWLSKEKYGITSYEMFITD